MSKTTTVVVVAVAIPVVILGVVAIGLWRNPPVISDHYGNGGETIGDAFEEAYTGNNDNEVNP